MVKPSIPLTLFRILNLIFTLTVTYFAIGVVALAWIPKLTFDSLPVWLILSSLLSGFTSYHYYKADLAQLDWSLPAGKWLKSAKTLIPYLLLAPSIYAVSISVRAQISHHGSFHSAIIYQISQGIIPPENAALAGAPTNYYWPYHALYASLVDLLQRPTPMISAAMNILVLAAVLGWIYQLLQAQYPKLSGWFTSLLSLLALLGGNLFGMYYQITIEGQFPPNEWFPYAFGDNRLNNILNKFLNFNGFPYGILLFVFSLYLYQRLLNDRFKFMDGLFLVTAGLGALGLHTTSGALVITLLPVALVLTLLLTKKIPKLPEGSWGWLITFSFLIAIPMLRSVWLTIQAQPTNSILLIKFTLAKFIQIITIIIPVAPLFIIEFYYAVKERSRGKLFFGLVALGGLGGAYLFNLPDGNEYKFILLSTISYNLLALNIFTPNSIIKQKWPRLVNLATLPILLSLAVNLLGLGFSLMQHSSFSRSQAFRYESAQVIPDDVETEPVFTDMVNSQHYVWIRDNTTPETLVVIPLANIHELSLLLIAERLPFIVNSEVYNRGLPETDRRSAMVKILYATNSSIVEKQSVLSEILNTLPERPKAFILPVENFEKIELGLVLKFQQGEYGVYQIP